MTTPFPFPLDAIDRVIVTAEQMASIESRQFEAGMPVSALMEKAASRTAARLMAILDRDFPQPHPHIGVLAGPGHNGGDALVIARELHVRGFPVSVYRPLGDKAKSLTSQQAQYVRHLGVPFVESVESLQTCDLFLDGLFGFGQTRPIEGNLAEVVRWINQQPQPLASIDIPSGLHTDTGEVLGTAVKATYTFCLGLWKLGFFRDSALDIIGDAELVEVDLPLTDVLAELGETPSWQRITRQTALAALPLPRKRATHKYKQGHLLLVCGSRQYSGAAILAGLGARASGVGMLSMAVPETVKPLVHAQLPEALVLGCPETEGGAIDRFPESFEIDRYDAIACGPGLTLQAEAVVRTVLHTTSPLILDADGLNLLSRLSEWREGQPRDELTLAKPLILTPHGREFRRLFPNLEEATPVLAARTAAAESQAIVVMKGARVAIAYPGGFVNVNPDSTPALARGGTGDVLTGLMGGLVATAAAEGVSIEPLVSAAVWWHAHAGRQAAEERSELGVDALTLTQYLNC
ncbi:NAD(P)H-hydrate dehydratase [Baaleninema sp.]|uniref:NAD(P)H-hydrate dehydratase n=1 Tax=Baaleninema sp. TaxID=3101197 RepID=UPI003CFD649B